MPGHGDTFTSLTVAPARARKRLSSALTGGPSDCRRQMKRAQIFFPLASAFFLSALIGCRSAARTRTPDDVITLAQGCMGMGEPSIAEALFQERLAKSPSDGKAAVGLAWAALALGDYQTAIWRAHKAESTLSGLDRAAAEILIARAYWRLGRTRQAWSCFYQVWRKGDVAVKSCIDSEIKAVASKLPRETPGVSEVLKFKPPPRKPLARRRAVTKKAEQPEAPLAIIPRSRWGPMAPRRSRLVPMGKPFRITVHHSADVNGSSPVAWGTAARHIQAIQRDHMLHRGWGDIGYHFIIDRAGRIWQGRSLRYQGAHAGNFEANRGNIGIVVEGNFEYHPPNEAQIRALRSLIHYLRRKYGIPKWRVYGHNHFRPTGCPGRYLLRLLPSVR